MNVMYEEEEDQNKESLKKPKKKDESLKKSARKKVFDRKQINQTVQNFVSYSKKDDLRMQRVSRMNDSCITVDQFKQTLKEMKYPMNNEDKFEMLVQAFKEDTKSDSNSKSGEVPTEPTISVKSLKKQLDIREKPKERIKKSEQDSAPSLKLGEATMKQDPSGFNKNTQDTLAAVNQFLKQNQKSDPKVLFKEMDRDGSQSVDLNEFVNYFETIKNIQSTKESELDKKMNFANLSALFKALDSDKSNSLDLKEFCLYIGYTEKLEQKKLDDIDEDT